MSMPAVPGAGLVVGQAEFGFGGFERILDRPAPALHPHQPVPGRAGRAPGREERQILIREAAPDQQAPRPHAGMLGAVFRGLKIGEFDIGPILPSIMLFPEFARDGGLIAYGPDLQDMFRRAGMMARRIIDGAISAELPVERPVRFNFIANLRTARALGLMLPPLLLIR